MEGIGGFDPSLKELIVGCFVWVSKCCDEHRCFDDYLSSTSLRFSDGNSSSSQKFWRIHFTSLIRSKWRYVGCDNRSFFTRTRYML